MTLPLSKEQIEGVQQSLARLRHQPGGPTKEQREYIALVIERLQTELTATRKALEEERERCAKVAERWAGDVDDDGCLISAPEGIAARIRALPAMTAQISQETARKMMDALTPFANCVFNDNGDMTVSYGHLNMHDRCIAAYFALCRAESELKDTHK